MNTYVKRLFQILGLLILFNLGCSKSFLTNLPQGSLGEDVLATSKGVEGLLIGAYSSLNAAFFSGNPWTVSPDNWVYGSVLGGDAHKGSEGGDQAPMNTLITYNITASNPYLADKWRADYEGISRCNNTLQMLYNLDDENENSKDNVEGQVLFLRAYFYMDLKKIFNMVPWIDENTEDVNQPNDFDIWPNIESDLKTSVDKLPEMQDAIGKINKWGAMSYLAKAYMYQDKFEDAKDLFDDIISGGITSNGLKYDLNNLFEDNWRPEKEDSNPESVFSIQNAANVSEDGVDQARAGDMLNYPYPNSPWCCGFYQPTQDLVNSYKTDPSTGLPYIDSYNSDPVKNDMGVSSTESFIPDNRTLDPRLDWTVGRRGIPFKDWGLHPGSDWIRDQSYGGPYSASKHLYWQETEEQFFDGHAFAPGSAVNYTVMRFSDILLLAAECEAHVGSLSKAEDYVNKIRDRAANPDGWLHAYIDDNDPLGGFSNVPAANYFIDTYPQGYFDQIGKDETLKRIYFERKLELALEGHRFFDLVRWGIASQAIEKYISYEGSITSDLNGANFKEGINEYLPIPQTEIDLSEINGIPVLTQNHGY